jgi:class 3 adenylate cyclase
MTDGQEHTFLFADLAGFTALTEVHGDEEAVQLVDEFCQGLRSGPAGRWPARG